MISLSFALASVALLKYDIFMPMYFNVSIVSGTVSSISTKGNTQEAAITIDKVYSGNSLLVNKKFSDCATDWDVQGNMSGSKFTVGDIGVWSVSENQGTIRIINCKHMPFRFRHMYKWTLRAYTNEDTALADFLIKMHCFTEAHWTKKLGIAFEHNKSNNVFLQIWSLHYLSNMNSHCAREFIRNTSLEDYPLATQLVLDEIRCAQLGEDWQRNPKRDLFLKSIYSRNYTTCDIVRLTNHVSIFEQLGYLDNFYAQYLLILLCVSQHDNIDDQKDLLITLAKTTSNGTSNNLSFDFIMNMYDNTESIAFKQHIAKLLFYFYYINRDQWIVLFNTTCNCPDYDSFYFLMKTLCK